MSADHTATAAPPNKSGNNYVDFKSLPKLVNRILLALIPIALAYVGKLFIMKTSDVKSQLIGWRSVDVSIDILMTSFAIVVGSLILGGQVDRASLSFRGWFFVYIMFAFISILVLRGLLPNAEIYELDAYVLTFWIPNFLAFVGLGWAVKVQE
jgi:hypothetical protein